MSNWVRLWEDMPTDPKWRIVRYRALQSVTNVTVGDIIAVFTYMLVSADKNGDLINWDDEVVAAALEYNQELVCAIREAMQGKVLDGNHLKGWNNRQPKRQDDSAERVKAFRSRRNDLQRDVTQCNAPEEKRIESESDKCVVVAGTRPAKRHNTNFKTQIQEAAALSRSQIEAANERGLSAAERETEWAKFKTYNRANGSTFVDWDATWSMWLDKRKPTESINGNGHDPMVTKFTPAELERHKETHKIYVKRETPAGEAWAEWTQKNTGHSQVWDAKGGWWFPSELPPLLPSENWQDQY